MADTQQKSLQLYVTVHVIFHYMRLILPKFTSFPIMYVQKGTTIVSV